MSVMNVSLGALSSPLPQPSSSWDSHALIKSYDQRSILSIVGNALIEFKLEIGEIVSQQKMDNICKSIDRILKTLV